MGMSESQGKSFFWFRAVGVCLVVVVLVIAVPNFIRARNTSARNSCVNNLRQIDGAKQQWYLENQKSSNDIPTHAEVALYLKNNTFPVCPAGGKYIVGRVDEEPKCSAGLRGNPSHVLPTP
jgi:hypothetical protein